MDNQNDNTNDPHNNPNIDSTPPPPQNVVQPQQPTVADQQIPQQQPISQTSPEATQQIPQTDPGRGLGIASLITAVLGLSLIAIILGVVGLKKTKKAGYPTNVLALIGTILGVISLIILTIAFIVLVFAGFQVAESERVDFVIRSEGTEIGGQSEGMDTRSKSNINSLYQSLEVYFADYGFYPSAFTAETFPGIEPSALIDHSGESVMFGDSTVNTLSDAESQSLPTRNQMYQYLPFNCTDNECSGYVLRAYMENEIGNLYTRYGLNNN